MTDLKITPYDLVRIYKDDVDITDDLGIAVSGNHSVNRNQEYGTGINTGVSHPYIREGMAEHNAELSVDSETFKALELIGEVDSEENELKPSIRLPEFRFENQATVKSGDEKIVEIERVKFASVSMTISADNPLNFDFSGQGTKANMKNGLLDFREEVDDKPVHLQQIKVKIDGSPVELLQDVTIDFERNLNALSGPDMDYKRPKELSEGKQQVNINTFSVAITDDLPWNIVWQGKDGDTGEYSLKLQKESSVLEFELPNGEVLELSGTLFGEVNPDDQDGDDGTREVDITGNSLSWKVKNYTE